MKIIKNKYVFCLLLLALNLLIYGYTFSANSYTAQDLPFIHKTLDHTLYPNDLYVGTMNAFPSAFISVMSGLSSFLPISAIYLSLYLLIRYAVILIAFNTAQWLFKDAVTSGLAALFIAAAPLANLSALLGGQPLMANFLYHGNFTVPFALFAFYTFLKGEYVLSHLVCALMVYFNPLMAAHTAVLLGFAAIPHLKDKAARKTLLRSWAAFFLVTALFVIKRAPGLLDPGGSLEYIAFLRSWHPEHYFYTSWSAVKCAVSGCFIAFFLLAIFKGLKDRAESTVVFFMAGFLFMWSVAALCDQVLTTRLMVNLQLFRSDIFFIYFGLLYSAALIKRPLLSGQLLPVLAGLLTIFFLTDLRLPAQIQLFVVSTVFLVLYWALVPAPRTDGVATRTAPIFALILIVTLLPYVEVIRYRLAKRNFTYTEPVKDSWHDLQHWALNHTEKDEAFLTPPYMIGFRVFSKRGAFVERLDGGAAHWKSGLEKEWKNRLALLGYGVDPKLEYEVNDPQSPLTQRTQAIYAALDEATISALSRQYGLRYVVEEKGRKLAFPLLYQNDHFAVYWIKK